MSVERIARALEGIPHRQRCPSRPTMVQCVDGGSYPATTLWCECDRGARQAAAVLEALDAYEAAHDRTVALFIGGETEDRAEDAGREAFVAALERIAGSPRPQEDRPND